MELFGIFLLLSIIFLAVSAILFCNAPKFDNITWFIVLAWVITSSIAGYSYFNKWWGILVALLIDAVLAGIVIVTSLESNTRIGKLISFLDNPDVSFRLKAVRSAASLATGISIELLCCALENDNESVRVEAAKALSMSKFVREEIKALKKALNDPSQLVREAATASLEKLGGDTASDEWFKEIDRLKELKSQDKSSVISLFAPPLPGLGTKILQVAVGTALTGSTNVGAIVAASSRKETGESIKLPEICCLCDINSAEKLVTISREVTASKVGMALGGPIMGKQRVDFSVPVCKLCATLEELSPGVELLDYKKIEGKWQIKLLFLNNEALNRFKEINNDRIVKS
jgi:hypothetical protein